MAKKKARTTRTESGRACNGHPRQANEQNRSRFQNERAGRQSRNRATRQEEQQQFPQTGSYLTAGIILHQFQEPVRKSHEFQFLPRTSCPFGKDTECRSPDPKRGRPRSEGIKTGGEQRTQR